jgi:drug/metabolite transporter (DMT)-like permease
VVAVGSGRYAFAAGPLLALGAVVALWWPRPALAPALSGEALFVVRYLGVASTALACYLWYKGLESVPAGTVAALCFLQPLVGAGFVTGGALMGVGVWMVNRERA